MLIVNFYENAANEKTLKQLNGECNEGNSVQQQPAICLASSKSTGTKIMRVLNRMTKALFVSDMMDISMSITKNFSLEWLLI